MLAIRLHAVGERKGVSILHWFFRGAGLMTVAIAVLLDSGWSVCSGGGSGLPNCDGVEEGQLRGKTVVQPASDKFGSGTVCVEGVIEMPVVQVFLQNGFDSSGNVLEIAEHVGARAALLQRRAGKLEG